MLLFLYARLLELGLKRGIVGHSLYLMVHGCKQLLVERAPQYLQLEKKCDMILIPDTMISWLTIWALLLSCVNGVFIRGKGASFPYEVYKRWQPGYNLERKQYVSLHMNYDAAGSSSGRAAIFNKADVEYAGSDSLMSDSERVTYPDLVEFPTMAG